MCVQSRIRENSGFGDLLHCCHPPGADLVGDCIADVIAQACADCSSADAARTLKCSKCGISRVGQLLSKYKWGPNTSWSTFDSGDEFYCPEGIEIFNTEPSLVQLI